MSTAPEDLVPHKSAQDGRGSDVDRADGLDRVDGVDVRPVLGVDDLVDWDFAKATGRRLVSGGPRIGFTEVTQVVDELREWAARAEQPVAETARLQAPPGAAPVLVVDRPSWIDANVEAMRGMLDPIVEHLVTRRPESVRPGAVTTAIGGKVTGGEVGGLLAFLATKVLGQFDIAPTGSPRLLLVAPNIVQAERDMQVVPSDFRAWVCMHEETHRVQFTAVPWLREYLITSARDLAIDLVPEPEAFGQRLQEIAQRLPEVFRSGSTGIAEVFATPEQRERMAGLTAVMSLLEGHADVVMDDVGPSVIPTVADIRAKFQHRRASMGSADRLLRRLLGLEAKMRQYRDGAVFVRGVTEKVGVDGFNQVWESPETLPTPAEIDDPAVWVARVHG